MSSEAVARLYRDVILAHSVAPRGHGAEIAFTHRAQRNNPLCGDDIEIRLQLDAGEVLAAAFTGEACAICLASTSLLCAHLPGQPAAQVGAILGDFKSGLAGDGDACPEFLAPLLGVRDYPARIACATLPWEAAVEAVGA